MCNLENSELAGPTCWRTAMSELQGTGGLDDEIRCAQPGICQNAVLVEQPVVLTLGKLSVPLPLSSTHLHCPDTIKTTE